MPFITAAEQIGPVQFKTLQTYLIVEQEFLYYVYLSLRDTTSDAHTSSLEHRGYYKNILLKGITTVWSAGWFNIAWLLFTPFSCPTQEWIAPGLHLSASDAFFPSRMCGAGSLTTKGDIIHSFIHLFVPRDNLESPVQLLTCSFVKKKTGEPWGNQQGYED